MDGHCLLGTIYLDYNLLAIMGGRTRQNAEYLENHCLQLVADGNQVALSAWHAVELSRSNHDEHIRACIDLVDRLQPLWVSNPLYVKTEELKGFLVEELEFPNLEPHANSAFNTVISQMWSTYGESFVGETFGHTVDALRSNPAAIETLTNAISETPKAIQTGRKAAKEGWLKNYATLIDWEYFKRLVPTAAISELDYLTTHVDRVLELCPAIAVEQYLTQIRVIEEFVPKESDASDLQHATVAVGYCDYFVSDDRMLVEHCRRTAKQVGADCTVSRDLTSIPAR